MTTSVMLGRMRDSDATRQEFLALARGSLGER
jgi:GTP cyclohydrolase I